MPKTFAVPPAPPHNEGKTVAAWTMTVGVVIGSILAAYGLIVMTATLMVVGAVIIGATVILSSILSMAGLGKKRPRAARS